MRRSQKIITFLSLIIGSSFLGMGSSQAADASIAWPTIGLKEAIKTGASGAALEELGQHAQAPETPEHEASWKKLKEEAEKFIRFRYDEMSPTEKVGWVTNCLGDLGKNLFCQHLGHRSAVTLEKPKHHDDDDEDLPDNRDYYKVAQFLTRGDISKLADVDARTLSHSLRSFSNWESLQPSVDAALHSWLCPSTLLLTGLGQKAEEFFPGQKYRDAASSLYRRAAACGGQDDDAADKARYRLALINIWSGQCREAEPLLAKISEQHTNDLASRALYWRSRCAKQLGDTLLHLSLKVRLAKEFPLSYHGLLLSAHHVSQLSSMLDFKEPTVYFRSTSNPSLNQIVRVVEVLQSLEEPGLAREFLESFDDGFQSAEIPFRLYVAVLMKRSEDNLGQFRILTAIFRDHPGAISRTTLEMYYPLKREYVDIFRRYGSKVDPYLTAALIRQESGFNSQARSPAGALGAMQLMPATARRFERVTKRELLDMKTNVRLGVKYFHTLLAKYGGNAELALAAYNAGPEKVDTWRRRYPVVDRILFMDLIPFKETREYVALIGRNYYWYLNLYAFGQLQEQAAASRKLASDKKAVAFSLFNSY